MGDRVLLDAERLLELGRHRQVAELVGAHLADDPGDPDAWRLLSAAQLGLREHAAALDSANRAVGAGPHEASAHLACSVVLHDLKQYAEAARAAQAAVELAPFSAETHRRLALSLSHLPGRGAEAERSARETLRLTPNSGAAWQALGYVLHARDPAGARSAYEKALALEPADATTVQNLAALHGRWGWLRSLDGFAQALALDPQNRTARSNLIARVNGLAFLLLFVGAWGLRLLALGRSGVVAFAVWLAFLATVVAYVVWRMPPVVRRSLGSILAPGFTRNRWALAGFPVGVAVCSVGVVWATHAANPRALLPGVVTFVGGCLAVFCMIAVAVAIRDQRRRTEP